MWRLFANQKSLLSSSLVMWHQVELIKGAQVSIASKEPFKRGTFAGGKHQAPQHQVTSIEKGLKAATPLRLPPPPHQPPLTC